MEELEICWKWHCNWEAGVEERNSNVRRIIELYNALVS